jgi:hypothetical protein
MKVMVMFAMTLSCESHEFRENRAASSIKLPRRADGRRGFFYAHNLHRVGPIEQGTAPFD